MRERFVSGCFCMAGGILLGVGTALTMERSPYWLAGWEGFAQAGGVVVIVFGALLMRDAPTGRASAANAP